MSSFAEGEQRDVVAFCWSEGNLVASGYVGKQLVQSLYFLSIRNAEEIKVPARSLQNLLYFSWSATSSVTTNIRFPV